MTGFLTSGLSALVGIKTALDVAGQNIANVNTPGYSRQRVDFTPSQPQRTLGGAVGNGVVVDGLERIVDEFVFESIVDGSTGKGRLDALTSYSERVNNLLADPELGIGPSIQNFFDALQDATADPSSAELRRVVLGEASSLTDRFGRIGNELQAIADEIDRNIESTIDEINVLSAEIADLNDQIAASLNAPLPPNDLYDLRDLALTRLAELVGIETVDDDDGSINVIALPGSSLVTGSGANELVAAVDPLDTSRRQVELRSGSTGASAPIELASGQLGGLVTARKEIVDKTLDQIGRTALTLATTLNEQSNAGFDLNGNFGADVFNIVGAYASRPSSDNTGTGSLTVTLDDLGALEGESYELLYDGTGYTAIRRSDDVAVAVSGTGTALDPLIFDGLSVVVAGTPAADDRFAIEATRAAATELRVAISSVDELAFAAPVAASAALNNTGDATIAIGGTVDINDANLLSTSTIAFIDPSTYSINGAGSFAYTSGSPIVLNGTEFTITGAPATGDQFTLAANTNAVGDNRNALELAAFRDRGVLDNGRTGLVGSFGQVVTESGIRTRNFQTASEAQDALLSTAVRQQQDVSGVDIDEEAANIVRFQQAYQAATQLVAISNRLFEELLGATQR